MIVRFSLFAFAGFALTAAMPPVAQDWRITATSGEKPDRTIYLIDAASINRKGDTVTFMTQTIFEQTNDHRDFDRSVTKRQGTCSTMTSQIMENRYFAGGSFQSTDSTPGNIITHKTNTVMYDTLSEACGTKALEAASIADPETQVRAYLRSDSAEPCDRK